MKQREDILVVGGGAYSARAVQAAVQLAKDALDGMRSRIGEQVTFEGRLVKCDALMRNIYVAEGRLAD